MDLNTVVPHPDCHINVASDAETSRPNSSTRRRTTRGLILRKGVWHIEGEASFVFWNAVDPLRCAVLLRASPGRPSCTPVRRMRLTPGGCGRNFPRSCDPASRRKPVICRPGKIPLDIYISPVFRTPRKTSKRSTCDAHRRNDKPHRVAANQKKGAEGPQRS
jgi:hypothetical protein